MSWWVCGIASECVIYPSICEPVLVDVLNSHKWAFGAVLVACEIIIRGVRCHAGCVKWPGRVCVCEREMVLESDTALVSVQD